MLRAGIRLTLVLFDVSIRGLSPSISTLLFDLCQSAPDHSAFVYFQRYFWFLHASLTLAHPLSPSHLLCVCVSVCECWYNIRYGLNMFCSYQQMCVRIKCMTQGCFISAWPWALLILSSFFFFNKFEQKHISSWDFSRAAHYISWFWFEGKHSSLLFKTLRHSHFYGTHGKCLYFCYIAPSFFIIIFNLSS